MYISLNDNCRVQNLEVEAHKSLPIKSVITFQLSSFLATTLKLKNVL